MTNRAFKTGTCREQDSFLPPRIEDDVERDNPVRAIEAFVCGLDLLELGFLHADYDGGPGQPPYAPADLLKLKNPRCSGSAPARPHDTKVLAQSLSLYPSYTAVFCEFCVMAEVERNEQR